MVGELVKRDALNRRQQLTALIKRHQADIDEFQQSLDKLKADIDELRALRNAYEKDIPTPTVVAEP